jgi:PBP1b-binding outer membrane lipoprotein LpoB
MYKRVTLLALSSLMFMAGCGETPAPQEQKKEAPAQAAPKKEEPPAPVYDLTKESITDKPDWSSRNVAFFGAKIGDTTTKVEKNFGKMDNTRTLADEYLTVYQNNGLFVYTQKLTGKLKKFEVYEVMSKQLADEKLKKLLTTGDLKAMHDMLGQEEKIEENADDNSTEYVYDARGFRFVKYKVSGHTVNALRFSEIKKSTT